MDGQIISPFEQLCKDREHFETPAWAAEAILDKEVFTTHVVDPCVGSGVLAEAAKARFLNVLSYDIHDWGYPNTIIADWLEDRQRFEHFADYTCFMNPPFSLAEAFIEKAKQRKFRKIVCFQRFAFWESEGRAEFWDRNPPSRVYVCGSRANCWRHDIPLNQRGSSTPTVHAWFVWDRDSPPGTLLGRIYKRPAVKKLEGAQ